MELYQILELVEDDLLTVNQELKNQTQSDVALINDIADYIISSGGKRIRPILTLLFARFLELENMEDAVKIATITELIHTATILHDDVVDDSSMRRGNPTVNKKYNNPAAVLVGDFVYTRAFQLIAEFNNSALMKLYTDAVNVIAEGEVKQLVNLGDLSITKERYIDVIYSKTARLFEVCCHAIAMLKYPNDPELQAKLAKFGTYLGTGFQIADDVLDYQSQEEESGKQPGNDLAEGKPTLPIIHLREIGTPEDVELVNNIILQRIGRESLALVLERLNANNCLEYCTEVAFAEAEKAKEIIRPFADSIYKEALDSVVDISVSRLS